MSGFNQVTLFGRIGNDLELKYTQGGTAALPISLATSRRKKEGEDWVEVTTWHRIKAFGKQAEALAQHAQKGQLLLVVGRLDYWEAQGERGKLQVAEIILEAFEFGGGARGEGGGGGRDRGPPPGSRSTSPARGASRPPSTRGGPPAAAPAAGGGFADDFADDDIPF